MQTNVGPIDAAIRWILAVVLFLASFVIANVMLSFLAALFALGLGASAAMRKCPLYTLAHASTIPHARPR